MTRKERQAKHNRWTGWLWLPAFFFLASPFSFTSAYGLSEIKREELPPAGGGDAIERPPSPIPLPEPVVPGAESLPGETTTPAGDETPPEVTDDRPIPDIFYDTSVLPAPARRMRELIIEACKTGDLEALRPLIGTGAEITQLALGGIESDPIEYLRQISGDEEGQEILAILLEIMQSGFVQVDAGTPQELYVWPYFFAVPLGKLDKKQRVELFEIVTAGDYEDMKSYGSYIFYRSAITPEGRWVYFVAGD